MILIVIFYWIKLLKNLKILPFELNRCGYIAVLQENAIELFEKLNKLVWRIEINTQCVKICSIFLNTRIGILVFTDEYGNIKLFDIKDGSELSNYNEVRTEFT